VNLLIEQTLASDSTLVTTNNLMAVIIGVAGIQLVARGPTVGQSAIISDLSCMFRLCKYINYIYNIYYYHYKRYILSQ
jgi:hypothetical protein